MHRFLLILFLPFIVHRADALILTLNPTADAFVTTGPVNDLINNNYGGAGALAVSAAGLAKGEFQTVLRFDTSSVVASFDSTFGAGLWQIDALTLTFNAQTPNNAIFNGNGAGPGGSNVNYAGQFTIDWMQNDGWTEGTGTPAAPTTTGLTYATLASFLDGADVALGTFSFNGATSGMNTWTLALAPSLTGDIAAGGGVSFRLFAADTAVSYLVNARSVPTVGNRPILSISAIAVPEPGGAALLALGAALVAFRRRSYAPTR